MTLEIVQVTSHVSFVKSPTAIGIVRNGNRAALIDTGLDENLARKVANRLKEEGAEVEAIVNTHAHADHFGGNAWLLARAPRARVHAPALDAPFITNPRLEPLTLFGAGAPRALQTKFLQAPASPVHEDASDGDREIIGLPWRFHPLPGHSLGQVAVAVDGVCFVSDALLPPATLEKYGIPFAVDPDAQRESARAAARLPYRTLQGYHAGVIEDAGAVAEANVRAIDAARDDLLALAEGAPRSSEALFAAFAERRGWRLSVEQHALNFATVRAHLAALERAGRLELVVEGGTALWRKR